MADGESKDMNRLQGLTIDDLVTLVLGQQEYIARLEAEIASLRLEIARLKGGGPPADGDTSVETVKPKRAVPAFVRPNRAPRKQKPRRKRAESFSRKREPAHVEVVHYPDQCSCCGRKLTVRGSVHRRRQVIDIPFVPYEVVDHVIMSRHCGVCRRNEVARPDLSAFAVGKSRFGVRLMALIAHLNSTCRMPMKAIRDLLGSLYGLRISVGAVAEVLHKVASCGSEMYASLRSSLRSATSAHTVARTPRRAATGWAFAVRRAAPRPWQA